MALVVLSKVEQRLDAVRAVLAGAGVVESRPHSGCLGLACMPGFVGIWPRAWRDWWTGRIDPGRVRIRSAIQWRCWSRRCAGSIHGGGRNGSGWNCCASRPTGS
jgi:hypothetical protein